MDRNTPRPEQEIFRELEELCISPGYVHALAHLCFRDNIVLYDSQLEEEHMQDLLAPSRLIRTETNLLCGLMAKSNIDWNLPAPEVSRRYIEHTEELLEELHRAVTVNAFADLPDTAPIEGFSYLIESTPYFREPIFYSGESAYVFQYQDLAVKKYVFDNEWLQNNYGFTIDEARAIALAVDDSLIDRFNDILDTMRSSPTEELTILPAFTLTTTDVAKTAGVSDDLCESVLSAFTLSSDDSNSNFCAIHDFNIVSAKPLLRLPTGEFLSLQSYDLAQALYDSPFYWMAQDTTYLPALTEHRGKFTETFSAERLSMVFGATQVHQNVNIIESKNTTIGEIDVLVIWGNRAIIVQAKSKRLTLEARKGNSQVIRADFERSVQGAYNQAANCARHMSDKRFKLVRPDGHEIEFEFDLKEIYIFCVVSDHYPALTIQAQHFLKTTPIPCVQPPMVLDVFTLDVIAEMLPSPLRFLSYIKQRTYYANKIMVSHELTALAYHLKNNLWFDPGIDGIVLEDTITAGLDIAMLVRRRGVDGEATPDGILTRFSNTTLGRIVRDIEESPTPPTIDLGFLLLTLSEEANDNMSRAINKLSEQSRLDHKHHDISFGFSDSASGLTVHINNDPLSVSAPRLESHCTRRKYKEKANDWFGICMDPVEPSVRFGITKSYQWEQDDHLDTVTDDMKEPQPAEAIYNAVLGEKRFKRKIGRNDPCPCGSGKKYKKCCLTRS